MFEVAYYFEPTFDIREFGVWKQDVRPQDNSDAYLKVCATAEEGRSF